MKVNELADTFLKLMREEKRQLLSVDMMTQEPEGVTSTPETSSPTGLAAAE